MKYHIDRMGSDSGSQSSHLYWITYYIQILMIGPNTLLVNGASSLINVYLVLYFWVCFLFSPLAKEDLRRSQRRLGYSILLSIWNRASSKIRVICL